MRGNGWWGGNEGQWQEEVPDKPVPAYTPFLLDLEKPRLTSFRLDSMICEKQFVPFDDQSLYCSEE